VGRSRWVKVAVHKPATLKAIRYYSWTEMFVKHVGKGAYIVWRICPLGSDQCEACRHGSVERLTRVSRDHISSPPETLEQ